MRRRCPHFRIDAAGVVYAFTWRLDHEQTPLAPAERDVVAHAIQFWKHTRCRLFGFVVMDDHVHVVFELAAGVTVTALLHSWKSFSAWRLQREFGRCGHIWQTCSYDHLVRDQRDLACQVAYVYGNPERRWPGIKDYRWVWTVGDPALLVADPGTHW